MTPSRLTGTQARALLGCARLHLALWLGALAMLAGCVMHPAPFDVAPAARTATDAFELEGRLSATDGERAASGRIHWQRVPGRDEWTFFSPLGQIVAQLVSTPEGAVLTTGDGRHVRAPDAESMLPQVLGVAAPVDGLPHWVQASARPGATILMVDEQGRPARIADQGWLIDYPEYADPDSRAAPRRLDARWGDTHIRLVIDQWTPLH